MNIENKNTTKIKFLFVLILSNATIFLFSIEGKSNESITPKTTRQNYIPMKIYGNLRTVFDHSYPVQLVSHTQTIKNIFILKEFNTDANPLGVASLKREYLVHIHKSEANRIQKEITYDILPHSLKIKQITPRKSYEIFY